MKMNTVYVTQILDKSFISKFGNKVKKKKNLKHFMLIILHLPPDLFSVHLSPAPCPGRLTSTKHITYSPWLSCS